MMNFTLRLWRVDITSKAGYQAPSFFIETSARSSWTREKAELEAIKLAKEKSGLGRFPKTWNFKVTHMEDHFLLKSNGWEKWVRQGAYTLENGKWTKKSK